MQSNKSEASQWEIQVGFFEEKKAKITFYDSKIKSFVDETTNRLGITERRKQEVRESQQEILNGGEGRGREGG